MKNYKYILLFIYFIYGESNSMDLRFNHTVIPNYSKTYSNSNIIQSAIIPGWGQYASGSYKKAFFFLCVETIALGVYYNYNEKGLQKEKLTRNFADQHWSFSNWVSDYYNFDTPEHRYIFERTETGSYKEIWGGGHKLEFIYNDRHHTTGSTFEDFYNQTLCPGGECDKAMIDSTIKVSKDHHYYENIGKYDHFFAGWDDNNEITEHVKNSGEILAMSPNKRNYRNDWEASAELNRFADYALYTIYTNHIISLLDILVFSKINKNSNFNYGFRTIYNPNNDLGIGGIQVLVSW